MNTFSVGSAGGGRISTDPGYTGPLVSEFYGFGRIDAAAAVAAASMALLRQVGVPTRYVTGFAAVETDPKSKQALLRGTHAHAWCRVWDAELL